jgi:integrase
VLAREYVTEEQRLEDEGHALYLAKLAEQTKAEAEIACAAGETSAAWYQRFMVYRRKTLGASCVLDSFYRWKKWVEPIIASKPIALVTADDCEAVRDGLRDAITAGKLAPRTAGDNWVVFTVAMKHASTRRGPPDLRVREAQGNPCTGIDPPPRGASKRRHWSPPAEIAAVLACPDVPIEWRETIAIGCYLHLRPGELQELRVKDIALDVGEVNIRRAWDVREKKVKAPKTDEGIRHVSVPSTLLPLLKRIANAGQPEDLVAPVLSATRRDKRAKLFRDFLRPSGVDRAELFVDTRTHEKIDFRSLRDTGITWRFLAGHRAEVVQRESGHEDLATTPIYAKQVDDRQGRFGAPFPPLPADLGGPDDDGPDGGEDPGEEPTTVPVVSVMVSPDANVSEPLTAARVLYADSPRSVSLFCCVSASARLRDRIRAARAGGAMSVVANTAATRAA